VFRSEIQGWRLLFLSELGAAGRSVLLDQKNDLRSDILLCGPAEASSSELMDAVSPRLVVIGGVEAPFNRGRKRERPKPAVGTAAPTIVSRADTAVWLELTRRACRVETEDGWFAIER
jgi:hypothetical protein